MDKKQSLPWSKTSFPDLELILECPRAISGSKGNYPVRIYRSFAQTYPPKPDEEYRWRWHLGFLRRLVEPLGPILFTTPYWAGAPWLEDGDFWLWRTLVVTEKKPMPLAQLNRELEFYIIHYNAAMKFMLRAAGVERRDPGESPENRVTDKNVLRNTKQ